MKHQMTGKMICAFLLIVLLLSLVACGGYEWHSGLVTVPKKTMLSVWSIKLRKH